MIRKDRETESRGEPVPVQPTNTESRKQLVQILRWGVTLGAIAWVLLKINWRDQVVLANGEAVRGHVQVLDDRYIVRQNGQERRIPLEETSGEDCFQPGFLTLFTQIRPEYLVLALFVYPLSNLLGAVRWRELMRAHQLDIGFMRCLKLTWLGFFWSLVFPGVTGGDVVKAYSVARTATKRAVAVLTVLLDRIIGMVGLAILSGVVILFNLHNQELRTVSTGILLFILAAVGSGVLFFSRRLRRWFGLATLMSLLPFQSKVVQLDEALFHYRYHKWTILFTILLSVGTHIVNVGIFLLAGLSLGLPVAWQNYFVFIPVMLMIAALPISVGGLGVFESGVAHFFTLRGVGATASQALALCVLYRLLTILVGLPGAAVQIEPQAESPEPVSRVSSA